MHPEQLRHLADARRSDRAQRAASPQRGAWTRGPLRWRVGTAFIRLGHALRAHATRTHAVPHHAVPHHAVPHHAVPRGTGELFPR